MKKSKIFSLLLFFFSLMFFSELKSDSLTTVWNTDDKKAYLGKRISILEDPNKLLQISDIVSPEFQSKFVQSTVDVPGYGVTESAFWVKINIQNRAEVEKLLLLELDQPQFDEVKIYTRKSEKEPFTERVTGDQYPFSSRDIEYYNYVFKLILSPKSENTVYLRLVMNGPTSIPLYLWEPESFFSYASLVMSGFGAFFGMMTVMLIYNVFLFFSVRDISYLYYVILVFLELMAAVVFAGLDAQYLWQNSPFFGELIHHWCIIFGNIVAILFTMNFLQTAKNIPRVHSALKYLIYLDIIIFFMPFLGHITLSIKANIALYLSTIPVFFFVGLKSYRKGVHAARFYLVAWVTLMISGIIFALSRVNIFPDNLFTNYAVQIGSTFQVLLFSFALADRINYLKKEREAALLDKLSESEKVASLSRAFERFVPKQFLEFLEKESIALVQLGDNIQKTMTILFCDIRSFTDLSEKMTPDDNFHFINEYLSRVGPLIRNHGGFIDKYIGDAIMALFPDHVEAAVKTAVDIHRAVKEFNVQRHERGLPRVFIGIGIHTGKLMLGTVGEENRMDTTVISDSVNLASRIEGLTKKLHAPIIISYSAYSKLESSDKYPHRYLGRFRVKGKKEAVQLIEIIEDSLDLYAAEKLKTKNQFEKAVSLYENQEYQEASSLFKAVMKNFPEDTASMIYILQCSKKMQGIPDSEKESEESVGEEL